MSRRGGDRARRRCAIVASRKGAATAEGRGRVRPLPHRQGRRTICQARGSASPRDDLPAVGEDFTRRGERYDVVLDIGADRSPADLVRALSPNGKLVLVGAPKGFGPLLARIVGTLIQRGRRSRRVMLTARAGREDLLALKELAEAGKLSPVIDRIYPLREVPEAFRYFGTGRVGGKIVIRID